MEDEKVTKSDPIAELAIGAGRAAYSREFLRHLGALLVEKKVISPAELEAIDDRAQEDGWRASIARLRGVSIEDLPPRPPRKSDD